MAAAWVALSSEPMEEAVTICRNNRIPWDRWNNMCVIKADRLAIYCGLTQKVQEGGTQPTDDPHYDLVVLRNISRREQRRQRGSETAGQSDAEKATMDRFIEYSARRYDDDTVRLEKEKKAVDAKVESAQAQLMDLLKDQAAVEAELAELEERGLKALHYDDLALEYLAIKKFRQVRQIDFEGEGDNAILIVTTNMIENNYGPFGRFRIIIKLGPGRIMHDHYGVNKITIEPIELVGRHYHYNPSYAHQSQYSNGFCYGTYGDEMVDSLKRYKYAQVIGTAIRFLEKGDEPVARDEE